MKRLSSLCMAFLLISCGKSADSAKENASEDNVNMQNPSSTVELGEGSDELNPATKQQQLSVQELVELGDSAACANQDLIASLQRETLPQRPSDDIQKNYREYHKIEGHDLNYNEWSEIWGRISSIENIVMTDFNSVTKEMSCSADFLVQDNSYTISYYIQPTADHSDVIFKYNGNIMNPDVIMVSKAAILRAQ